MKTIDTIKALVKKYDEEGDIELSGDEYIDCDYFHSGDMLTRIVHIFDFGVNIEQISNTDAPMEDRHIDIIGIHYEMLSEEVLLKILNFLVEKFVIA